MARENFGIIILAAGEGARMKSAHPKVLQPVAGKPMLGHVLDAAGALGPERLIVVTGSGRKQVDDYIRHHSPKVEIAHQKQQHGTGHAVQCAAGHFEDFKGNILILFGDCPLITTNTLQKLIQAHRGQILTMIGIETKNPRHYGRLVLAKDGGLEKIVEFTDASAAEAAITFCNSGVMIAEAGFLFRALSALKNDNAKNEYYLTDVIATARGEDRRVDIITGEEKEFQGVNSKSELAAAEAGMQDRLREAAMAGGATLIDPATVYLSADTELGRDVTVWPHVVFGPGVVVEEGATIHSFTHLEGAHVKTGATIGPFARLRPGAEIGEGAKIGNFVEIKKADIGEGAKISHLSYIGDAKVGKAVNIGAGVITCNYDGFKKYLTEIGAGAFIGSNVALIAPVRIGAGAIVGAGSVITKEVPADDLGVARSQQRNIRGGARVFRNKRNNKKS